MTIQRLSAESVKIQLSAEELKPVMTAQEGGADSPQMLRLISALLRKAEEMFAIPFSENPVTVELFAAPEGGLVIYLTAQHPDLQGDHPQPQSGSLRISACFRERDHLRRCCTHLLRQSSGITQSILYRYAGSHVLYLRVRRGIAPRVKHILTEFGLLFPLSAVNRARLTEFGKIILPQNAVADCAAGRFRA